MERSGVTDAITRYGIFMERQAVMITDTIRALILEYYGYKTQVMEFIEMEHTPKNVLLVGKKTSREPKNADILRQISDLKAQYGVKRHYLETVLDMYNVPQNWEHELRWKMSSFAGNKKHQGIDNEIPERKYENNKLLIRTHEAAWCFTLIHYICSLN